VFYSEARFTYEQAFNQQIEDIIASKGAGDLDKLLRGPSVWEVKG
jgi:2-oxoglutarate ferredoxin oxidoreductase subunit beta